MKTVSRLAIAPVKGMALRPPDEIRLELSEGSGGPATGTVNADIHDFEEGEPAVGLEQRVVRLERAMTATLDLLQQMRRSQTPLKPLDPLNN